MRKARQLTLEAVRARLRDAATASGMTQEEIGLAMGYSKGGARQAVSRLLNSHSDNDPRLTTLIQFASAIDSSLPEILG